MHDFKNSSSHKLYDVTPTTEQYEAFKAWEYEPGFDFFRLVTAGRTSNVLVAPERRPESLSNF